MAATDFTHAQAIQSDATFDASQLKGKSVIITGGASGIGEECVRAFVIAGAFVTFGDVAADLAESLVNELGNDKVAFVKCDTRNWDDQVAMFKTAIEKSPCQGVDIVLANAGISGIDQVFQDNARPDSSEPVKPDLSVLEINLLGFTYTTKLALHYFARQPQDADRDRCLILTASLAGYIDLPGAPQYQASKHGTKGLMRSLRRTMPAQGGRVNIIAPWFIKTRILSQQARESLAGRGIDFAEPEDAASAVLYLASDKNLNGRAIAVVTRDLNPRGYMDLEVDDYREGELLTKLQGVGAGASHRTEGK